ncbi:MAG TPA: aldo/keto reductase [bacterium]|nr:aldo/keto reductase [bacterium]
MSHKHAIQLSRRDVLKTTGALLPAGLAMGNLLASAPGRADEAKMPTRVLGRTGRELSVMTLGCGHLRASFMDRGKAEQIVIRALELGVNSIDTAPNYQESEDYLGEILKDLREKVFLATKNEEATYKEGWELLRKSLKRLKTEYLDLVYIHNLGMEGRFADVKELLGPQGVLAALVEAKKQGVVKAIGVSGHLYPSRFKAVLERDEIDVFMCAVNFVARHQYNFEEKVFEPARQKNAGLIAMKVMGGAGNWSEGQARLAEENLDLCVRYALDLPGVCSANLGVRTLDELETAVQRVKNFTPLTGEEKKSLEQRGRELANAWGPMYGTPVA